MSGELTPEEAVIAEAERIVAPRRLVWVPKVADPSAPTSDEINAGVDLGDPGEEWQPS